MNKIKFVLFAVIAMTIFCIQAKGVRRMTISEQNNLILDKAVQTLAKLENFSATLYQCSAGTDTIGYGFTDRDLVRKGRISKAEADRILRNRCSAILSTIRGEIVVPLTVNQMAALVSFTYNVGEGAFRSSTLKTLINRRAYNSTINAEFNKWIWSKCKIKGVVTKTISRGLQNRRAAEIALWNT